MKNNLKKAALLGLAGSLLAGGQAAANNVSDADLLNRLEQVDPSLMARACSSGRCGFNQNQSRSWSGSRSSQTSNWGSSAGVSSNQGAWVDAGQPGGVGKCGHGSCGGKSNDNGHGNGKCGGGKCGGAGGCGHKNDGNHNGGNHNDGNFASNYRRGLISDAADTRDAQARSSSMVDKAQTYLEEKAQNAREYWQNRANNPDQRQNIQRHADDFRAQGRSLEARGDVHGKNLQNQNPQSDAQSRRWNPQSQSGQSFQHQNVRASSKTLNQQQVGQAQARTRGSWGRTAPDSRFQQDPRIQSGHEGHDHGDDNGDDSQFRSNSPSFNRRGY